MAWFNRSLRIIILTAILAMALTMGFGANLSAQVPKQLRPNTSLSGKLPSQWNFTPPRRGIPVNRQGGATRGNPCIQHPEAKVTALVPASRMAATASAYPTLFWNMPQSSASEVELLVRDTNDQDIYSAKYTLAKSSDGWVVGSPGIMSLSLPAFANLSPLEIGQDYYWMLRLRCPMDSSDSSNDIVVGGGIVRVKPDPTLAQRIQQATPQERVALYANAGFWYETVASLAELRRDRPNDNELAQAWNKLLNSVGLDNTFNKLPTSPR
ncbi:DUF928 domain-containing protein [Allocoleopsis franciscana]|uniref:DUF928 domain-containing protein n=1 Tax=Allocoleopsis franciscana PCC 7113 TaxID=1173027 RepID=K9WJT9_9CYAN|nr:DUF928 domain-containing protein [Allocoleopsis franciscana]AFZ20463.1 protein of unknown function (DUF928) [Allocoleopsis franciscana PCC 7113]